MGFQLSFDHLVEYDSGQPGISIEVQLSVGSYTTRIPAKVDTGSDSCVFSRQCGIDLGLEVEAGEPQRFRTATGSFKAYGHTVTLETAGFEFDSTVYFAAEEAFERNVLGRFGWLDRVIVGIDDYDGNLYLSQHP